MRWKLLVPPLGAILLAALAFAFWPEVPAAPSSREPAGTAAASPPTPRPTPTATAPQPTATAPQPVLAPAPQPPAPQAQPATEPATATEAATLDPEPDPEHLRALGLTEADVEPPDAGPLHKLDKGGIKGAVQEKLPEIRECYDAWLAQNPALAGKVKVEFRITEIAGRDRAKVMGVDIPDGGLGHVAMEGCVKNVFSGLRFEAPRGGEMKVTYPLAFEARKENAPAP